MTLSFISMYKDIKQQRCNHIAVYQKIIVLSIDIFYICLYNFFSLTI